MADDFPVHQVGGVQNRQTGNAVKRRGCHVVILATGPHTDIWVGIIGIDHRVCVGTVAIIRRPHFRFVSRLGTRHQGQSNNQ